MNFECGLITVVERMTLRTVRAAWSLPLCVRCHSPITPPTAGDFVRIRPVRRDGDLRPARLEGSKVRSWQLYGARPVHVSLQGAVFPQGLP
jgi:hypothetical protein